MNSYISHSPSETKQYGVELGNSLPDGAIVLFYGDLGAGKTTFIKGLASAISGSHEDEVNSPTFSYLNIYEGDRFVYHFDLYRLENSADFFRMGFDEYLFAGGISCVEWSEKLEETSLSLFSSCYRVTMKQGENETRIITIESP